MGALKMDLKSIWWQAYSLQHPKEECRQECLSVYGQVFRARIDAHMLLGNKAVLAVEFEVQERRAGRSAGQFSVWLLGLRVGDPGVQCDLNARAAWIEEIHGRLSDAQGIEGAYPRLVTWAGTDDCGRVSESRRQAEVLMVDPATLEIRVFEGGEERGHQVEAALAVGWINQFRGLFRTALDTEWPSGIGRTAAMAIARSEIESNKEEVGAVMILDGHTVERSWGWVFFWDLVEEAEEMDRVYGNAPIFVDRTTGEVAVYGTWGLREQIARHEGRVWTQGPMRVVVSSHRVGLRKVAAIKFLRAQRGVGLKEAKSWVDAVLEGRDCGFEVRDAMEKQQFTEGLESLGFIVEKGLADVG